MNFAEARFWGFLLRGLGLIALLRLALWQVPGIRRDLFDKVALFGLGPSLLVCVSWVTLQLRDVMNRIISCAGLRWA